MPTREKAMATHPVQRNDVLRRKWMVPGSGQRRDDYCQEQHYTRLVDRSGAAEGELRTGRQRPGDEGHRHLRVRLACDKARTERGWRGRQGQLREHNEDAPACGDPSSKLVMRFDSRHPLLNQSRGQAGS